MTISREDKELLERLAERSADLDGLDRKTLREISDQEGWGLSDEPRTYRTKTGRVLTDADIEALADEAEREHNLDEAEYNYFAKTTPLTEQALAFVRKYLAKGKSVLKGRV